VYRLHRKPDAPDLFLKQGQDAGADDLTEEMGKLRWFGRHAPVPRIEQFVATPGEAWLLTQALPGATAYDALAARPDDRGAIVEALAIFLRRLHAIPASSCPFNAAPAHRLALARDRIDAGLVDEEDFDEERGGWTAEQVWDAANSLLPFEPDLVVTHGDYSLDNILVSDGKVVGCIDLGRAGLADRYQDLAILWNGLGEFGEDSRDRFLTCYGTPVPDRRRLQFHLLMDELF